MDENISHQPLIQRGVVVHLGFLLILLAASGYLLWSALIQQVRGVFILYLIACVTSFLPFPFFLYRLISLLRANYSLSRDGVSIQWGLRIEEIPMADIEWVRLPEDIATKLPMPRINFPGAILGVRNHRDLGKIEYIASDINNLMLIATKKQIFAISPRDISTFQNDFYRFAEMGSITPIAEKSNQPQFILSTLFKDKAARRLLFSSAILSLLLLIVISFIIPTRDTVPLGLEAIGANRQESPSERLILLPLLSLFVFFVDFGFGSYLFRKKGFKSAAYIVFSASLILPLSFTALLLLILFS
ncbi:MAG: PH domain-containing protein [Pelolinea sp.]|nr:PH domain-containing protein [Pelolinea sp.]